GGAGPGRAAVRRGVGRLRGGGVGGAGGVGGRAGAGGFACRVGAAASPRRAARSRVRRGGFRPDAVLVFRWGLSAREHPTDIGRLSLGAAAGRSGAAAWDDRDVDARPATTHSVSSTRDVVVVTDTQTGGIHAQASLASM